jgi:hypothetical protein
MIRILIALLGSLTLGCTTAPADGPQVTEIEPAALPAAVSAVIAARQPDFVPAEVLKKVREGRVYYDVEGALADGTEIEFDVLMEGTTARIVEVQRDLDWRDVPAEVRAVGLEASGGAVPVRIIESVQADGAIIYELFADGRPADPAYEIRVRSGTVELLEERWVH